LIFVTLLLQIVGNVSHIVKASAWLWWMKSSLRAAMNLPTDRPRDKSLQTRNRATIRVFAGEAQSRHKGFVDMINALNVLWGKKELFGFFLRLLVSRIQ